MSRVSSLCLASLVLGFASISLAQTPPEFSISDNSGNTVTIDSSGTVTFGGNCTPGTCSTTFVSAASGIVDWAGTVGTFSMSLTVGLSKPVITRGAYATSNCSIVIGGGISVGQFTTYTQGGWGPHRMAITPALC